MLVVAVAAFSAASTSGAARTGLPGASGVQVAPAAQAATCTQAQKDARIARLTAFKRGMAARKKAFFRIHKSRAARSAFLRKQRAKLRALQRAAACTVVVTPPPATVLATIPLQSGNRFTFAAGSLWVNRGPGATEDFVTRIDPATNLVTAKIAVAAGGGLDIASGFGSIWEVDYGAASVSRIDPATNHVVASIPTQGTAPIGVAMSANAVWVGNHNEPPVTDGASIVKIDPASNQVVHKILVGTDQGGPAWVTSAAGSIWAFDQTTTNIVRVDPASNAMTTISSPLGRSANRHFATDGSTVWFSIPKAGAPSPQVQQVDPATSTISTTVGPAVLTRYGMDDVFDLDFAAGSLWVLGPCGSTQSCILRLDPATKAVVADWTVAGPGEEILYAAGSLWLSEPLQGTLLRLAAA